MPTKRSPAKRIASLPKSVLPPTRNVLAGSSTWEVLAKSMLALGAFLTPLAVGSWTPDRWEIHKVMLLTALVTLAWLFFAIGQLRRPTVGWRWHPLDWLVVGLTLASVVGTVTSADWWISLAGIQGVYVNTLPVLLSGISIYVLSARLFRTANDRMIMWASLLGGLGLSLLGQLFAFSGISLWPASLTQDAVFSTLSGTTIQVALLAAIVATGGFLLWPKARERWAKLSLLAIVAIGWLVMLFLGQSLAWAMFALGMILVVMANASTTPTPRSGIIITAVVLAASGLLTQFLHLNSYTSIVVPSEVTLRQTISYQTAITALADRPVLGTGPNTWYVDFVRYRPTAFNTDRLWSSRFLRAGSAWPELLATQGVVGVGFWLGLLALAGWTFWRQLRRGYSYTLLVSLFVVGMILVISFLTTWSLVLMLVFWVALGLGRAKVAISQSSVATTPNPVAAFGFAVIVLLGVVFWVPAVRIYASDMALQRTEQLISKEQPLAAINTELTTAVKLNGRSIDAVVLLANVQAQQAVDAIQQQSSTAQSLLTAAMGTVHAAVIRHPHNPVTYEAENNLLNGLAPYLSQPEQQANGNFQTLRRLEPANPIHDVGYGQTLMVIRARLAADTTTVAPAERLQSLSQQAVQAYDSALEKKPDYSQARYARAEAQVVIGNYSAALGDLQQLTTDVPSVAQYWSVKASVLAKLDRLDDAKTSFEQALVADPQDPTIFQAYAQVYLDAKKNDEAKSVIERGLKVFPGDQTLTEQQKKLPA